MEHHRFLRQVGDLMADVGGIALAKIVAVDARGAVVGRQYPHHQVQQGRFAAGAGTDDADGLPRIDAQGDVLKDRRQVLAVLALAVTEAQVLKIKGALNGWQF